jgi:hypothetical protein
MVFFSLRLCVSAVTVFFTAEPQGAQSFAEICEQSCVKGNYFFYCSYCSVPDTGTMNGFNACQTVTMSNIC